ncbi:hypothetical protein DFH09DRAFT_1173259 [Mycena vulgaris]|nr:hypothetical protein DFH09DRAFT_1173259 [Mycena vulgaris]
MCLTSKSDISLPTWRLLYILSPMTLCMVLMHTVLGSPGASMQHWCYCKLYALMYIDVNYRQVEIMYNGISF